MPDGTRHSMLAVALAYSVAAASSLASTLPHYRVEATLSRTAPQIHGTIETTVTNRGTRPLDAVVLVLFANRFAAPDAEVTDVNRAFVYPYEEFEPGWTTVQEVRIDGVAVPPTPFTQPGVPEGCLLRVVLPAPLPPGAAASLRVRFETAVP